MTRSTKPALSAKPPSRSREAKSKSWQLQDAKARFSELVRRVKSEGPQHVTVHGKEEVVVIAADEFRRLIGERTGKALIAVLQASPHRHLDIEPTRTRLPVRDLAL